MPVCHGYCGGTDRAGDLGSAAGVAAAALARLAAVMTVRARGDLPAVVVKASAVLGITGRAAATADTVAANPINPASTMISERTRVAPRQGGRGPPRTLLAWWCSCSRWLHTRRPRSLAAPFGTTRPPHP